jgi:uncharacterized membrane protein YqhA
MLVLLAIFGSFVTSVAVMATGIHEVFKLILRIVGGEVVYSGGLGRYVAVTSLELIDLFLIGAVLLIIAIGLYQLFIDDQVDLPPSLIVHSLEELKERILGVVIVLLTIVFLGVAANWDGNVNILALGASVSLVICAIGVAFHFIGLSKPEYPPKE